MHPMLTIAQRAARRAGEKIAYAIDRLSQIKVEEKGRHDYVSEIDRAAEVLIIETLQRSYPEHGILGEESGLIEGRGAGRDYLWVIDPLDGTTNFLHGVPHCAVSIGLRHRGQLDQAIVLDPFRQEEFTASRGAGAQLNGRRIRVSDRKSFPGSLLATGFPFKPVTTQTQGKVSHYFRTLEQLAGVTAGIRRAGSAALDLAYVAAGRYDGYWELDLQAWDLAAGALLVQEAGGLVSDHAGGQNFLDGGDIVAAAPRCHKVLLDMIRHGGGEKG